MASDSIIQHGQAVTVSLEELRSGSVSFQTLEEAFGPDSLGIIVVKDLPEKFEALRKAALSNSSQLAALPKDELASLESPQSRYLIGWSHGKETLRPGVVDTHKGSYYINCAFYQKDQKLAYDSSLPEYTSPNIWPSETSLPTFRSSLEELITLIIDVAVLVARACDRYAIEIIEGYKPGYLEHVVQTSLTTKARLLHYFPEENTNASTSTSSSSTTIPNEPSYIDTWCATHKDYSCLTGLTSAMFLDESSTSSLTELPTSPSSTSGLYIHSRSGTTTKIAIPRCSLAFQTGRTLERITQGKFKAVPHFVRGVNLPHGDTRQIARNTLAVFMQPNLDEVVDLRDGRSFGDFARQAAGKNTATVAAAAAA